MPFIIPPLINKIIDEGYISADFKKSVVSLIFKKGDIKNVSNYRPISLITTYAKIFEKVLNFTLVKFLNKCNIISDNQYGFRQGLSTNDAIVKFVYFWF